MSHHIEIHDAALYRFLDRAGHLLQAWKMESLEDETFTFSETRQLLANIGKFQKGETVPQVKITDRTVHEHLKSRGHKHAGWSARPGEPEFWTYDATEEVQADIAEFRRASPQRRAAPGRSDYRKIATMDDLLSVLVTDSTN